jgi:hypothetical protein
MKLLRYVVTGGGGTGNRRRWHREDNRTSLSSRPRSLMGPACSREFAGADAALDRGRERDPLTSPRARSSPGTREAIVLSGGLPYPGTISESGAPGANAAVASPAVHEH